MWSSENEAVALRSAIFSISSTKSKTSDTCSAPNFQPASFYFAGYNADFVPTFRVEDDRGEDKMLILDEHVLTESLYTNEAFYNRVRTTFCLAYDIALAKGCSEAVVESLYSVMKTQNQCGRITNDVLVNRTKVDWHCPNSVLGIMDFVGDAAKIHTKKMKTPLSRMGKATSTVFNRLKAEVGKIPY